MGRYLGPACKLCRREGMKLFLKGIRCGMAKCPIERERPVPGMHGQQRGRRKVSDYGVQLREKQRLRRQYGLREGPFRLLFQRAARRRGITGEVLLQLLETRLDSVVFRLGFAPSRASARQFVRHGHILLDGKKASIPSMNLAAGSVVQVCEKPKSRALAEMSLKAAEGRELAPWLTRDDHKVAGELERVPSRDEIAPIVDEQLVVELYSK